MALPSAEEARQGALAAGDNAYDLVSAARHLGVKGLYGPAISLLVLSLEEAQKARVLVAVANGDDSFRVTEAELRQILGRDHKLRLRAAWAETISPARVMRTLKKSPRPLTPFQRKQSDAESAVLKWLSEANSLKHRGLYVNFVDDRWESPRDLGEDEYLYGLHIAETFVEVTLRQTTSLTP